MKWDRRQFIRNAAATVGALGAAPFLGAQVSHAETASSEGKPQTPPVICENRNAVMLQRIESAPVRYPFRFVMAGDTGGYYEGTYTNPDPIPDPGADARFTKILEQIEALEPKPLFFMNLGDFAGPGTIERHQHYLHLTRNLEIPNLCCVGNHDLDTLGGCMPLVPPNAGWDNFRRLYGPENYAFAYGHTQFAVISCQDWNHVAPDPELGGPRPEDLDFLEQTFTTCERPHRVIMMHMPPNLDNHYQPYPVWGFTHYEREFMSLLDACHVRLVCCAHVICYDRCVRGETTFIVSGGGGWGVFQPPSTPPNRGHFHHFVEIEVDESGAVTGRVHRPIDGINPDRDYDFTLQL